MSGYRIVEFTEDPGKPVEAVPASWLIGESQAKWPKVGSFKISSLIRKCSLPQDHPNIEWKIVTCRIICSAVDYRQARKAALQATVTSDVELTDAEGMLQNENNGLRNPTVNATHQPPDVSNSYQSSNEGVGGVLEIDVQGADNNIFTLEVPHSSKASNVEQATNFSHDDILRELQKEIREYQSVVLENLVKITKELDHISRVVGRMNVSSVQNESLDLPDGLQIPIKDAREFSILQQWMQSKTNQSNLASFRKGIGGSNWKGCTRRILDRMIAPELGKSINLSGANGKISFRSHFLRNCMISSLRNDDSPNSPTEKEVDEYVVRYFGGAKDRNGGRAARQKQSLQD